MNKRLKASYFNQKIPALQRGFLNKTGNKILFKNLESVAQTHLHLPT